MINQIYRLLVKLLTVVTESFWEIKRIAHKLDGIDREQDLQSRQLERIEDEQREQSKKLDELLAANEVPEATEITIVFDVEGQITEGNATMTNSQQAIARLNIVDKLGKPAPVDGVPAWATSDETIITVTPSEDGMTATVAAVGPLGAANVSVTADADLGAGVKPLFGTGAVTVTQGQAVGITISFDAPTEQGTGEPEPPTP